MFVQFASLTGVMFVTTVAFYFGFSTYDKKEDEMGKLEEKIGDPRQGLSMGQDEKPVDGVAHPIDEEP